MSNFIKEAKYIFIGHGLNHGGNSKLHAKTILIIGCVAGPTSLLFSVVNYLNGRMFLAAMLLFAFVLLVQSVRFIYKETHLELARNILLFDSEIIYFSLFIDGGIANIAFVWSLLFPFLAFLLVGLPKAWYWIGSFVVALFVLISLHFLDVLILPYTDKVLLYFFTAFIFFSLVAASFKAQFERLELKLQQSIRDLDGFSQSLEKEVKNRTRALEISNQGLKKEIVEHKQTSLALQDSENQVQHMQKMETIGTLVGGIAHDFNNMLAGISANIFMIKRNSENDLGLLKRTKNIETLVSSASETVRQLLTFARKDRVEFQYFDLAEELSEIYQLVEVGVPENVSMNFSQYNGKLPVYASKTQIQQVLMNIVNNARDAVENEAKPSIVIDVATEQLNSNDQLFALIRIVDNGVGILDENQEKVFEPFFTTKGVGKGSGLGLAMSYGSIRSHGGMIKVESKSGEGSVFKIYLPLSANTESTADEEIKEGAFNGEATESILLVDDDKWLRESQRDVLDAMGYTILEAENGEEAVAVYAENKNIIDLVVMDLTMPVMGGVEAAKQMRKLSPNLSVIFMTGYDMSQSMGSASIEDFLDTVLEKPFTMNKLSTVIRQHLSN